MTEPVPVHESLRVLDSESIYRTDEWWKAVVRYQHEDADDDAVAIYLWHHDDGWTRKNKYVVKTAEAWESDRRVVDQLFAQSFSGSVGDEYPVSDYYTASAGQTVFQEHGWWKAILKISQKGSYDTEEVMIYLWQRRDDDWYRKQKYTIKDEESWAEEKTVVESVLDTTDDTRPRSTTQTATGSTTDSGDDETTGVMDDIEALEQELDAHLSDELT